MTVRELKNFLENCNNDAYITMCGLNDDNPVKDCYGVGMIYMIRDINNTEQVCLMPD